MVNLAGVQTFEINRFLGLHESGDGDTILKAGEASVMRNFRVTTSGALKRRNGIAKLCDAATGHAVRGMWRGMVAGAEVTVLACNGHCYQVSDAGVLTDLGTLTDAETTFFDFGGKLYVLNGHEYKVWSGTGAMSEVDGYIPLVVTAAVPAGGGTTLEGINLLQSKRREKFTSDGTSTAYQLAEKPIAAVVAVTVDGTATTAYTVNLTTGVVSFTSAPAAGLSNVEITYDIGTNKRSLITANKYSERYNGYTDSRVFVYGSGTNAIYYTGVDTDGAPRADYFPALNEVEVGSANTPVTGLQRHYSRMLAFKPEDSYKIEYSSQTLADGSVAAGFYVRPLNREIGNVAPGQIRICNNTAISLCHGAAWQWVIYNTTAALDERNARKISQRVETSLHGMDLTSAVTFDDAYETEFWIVWNGEALIYNYGLDVWYRYTGIKASCLIRNGADVWFGGTDGALYKISETVRNDCGTAIDAYWESGSMDMVANWKLKYSKELYVTMKPESGARVTVTARSDRRSDYAVKAVVYGLSTFTHANFAHWSFNTNRMPHTMRCRVRVPHFGFYKLIFEGMDESSVATILNVTVLCRAPQKVRR